MFPYHNQNIMRIKNGELIGIEPSDKEEFACVLVFKTFPVTRPIRPHALYKYDFITNCTKIKKEF